MSIEKLDLQSPDKVKENFQKLAELFPNCVTETAEGKSIDFDLLKQELKNEVVEGNKERYRLEWPGKREAIVTANIPTNKTLRPIKEDSVDFDNTENLYIEGDNLEVLKLLQESYLGKIKMIYIDPPYNTGKDFIYKDNFTQNTEEYKQESGQVDENKLRLFQNPETAGRYHSDWLTMMYPRLKLARNLLTDDGVIFISIDDNEVHNLRKICDEIFGEGNFVAEIIWEKKFAPSNDAKWFSDNHDYILIYAKDKVVFRPNLLERDSEALNRYKNPDNDVRGNWVSGDMTVKTYNINYDFEITTPSGRVVSPPKGICWRFSREKVNELIKDNRVWFGANGDNVPRLKRFLTDVKDGITPMTIWYHKDVAHNQEASQELRKIFDGEQYFETPKPIRLLTRIVKLSTSKSSIILDFFSGSATTAHAVMQLNAEASRASASGIGSVSETGSANLGKRKFIMVQIPEPTDEKSEAYKAGYKNICEIGKERIRRAGKKIKDGIVDAPNVSEDEDSEELDFSQSTGASTEFTPSVVEVLSQQNIAGGSAPLTDRIISGGSDSLVAEPLETLDIGFRVLRLDSSNLRDVYYKPQDIKQEDLELFSDNLKEDRSPEDILFQILLDWGLPLSLKIQNKIIAGKKVFLVADNSLYACFEKGIDENFAREVSKDKPLRIVFRDSGFKDDTAKTNVQQLLKQLSPETEVRVF